MKVMEEEISIYGELVEVHRVFRKLSVVQDFCNSYEDNKIFTRNNGVDSARIG